MFIEQPRLHRVCKTLYATFVHYTDSCRLSRQLQTVKTVADCQDICRLSRQLQTDKTVAECLDNCRELQTVQTTEDSCRPLHICLFLSVKFYYESHTLRRGGVMTMACLSIKSQCQNWCKGMHKIIVDYITSLKCKRKSWHLQSCILI